MLLSRRVLAPFTVDVSSMPSVVESIADCKVPEAVVYFRVFRGDHIAVAAGVGADDADAALECALAAAEVQEVIVEEAVTDQEAAHAAAHEAETEAGAAVIAIIAAARAVILAV